MKRFEAFIEYLIDLIISFVSQSDDTEVSDQKVYTDKNN